MQKRKTEVISHFRSDGGGHGTRPSASPDGLRTAFSAAHSGCLRTRACRTIRRIVRRRLCPHGSESPRHSQKNKITPARVSFCFWRRTWDSNPRGCYTLLDFQSSSLATRSILQIICCSMPNEIAKTYSSEKHLINFTTCRRILQGEFCRFS